MKRTFILAHAQARANALECVRTAPEGFCVTVGEPSRSLEQNSAQWPILEAYAKQKQLCVNGVMVDVTAEEWKDVLTGAFSDELARVASYRGRMVILGKRTSKFDKQRFSAWLDWLNAAAIEDGIVLDECAVGAF